MRFKAECDEKDERNCKGMMKSILPCGTDSVQRHVALFTAQTCHWA